MNQSVELSIHDENDITLPAELAASPLSFSEIGALFTVLASQKLSDSPNIQSKLSSPEFAAAGKSLVERGVVTHRLEGTQLTVSIDLNSIIP